MKGDDEERREGEKRVRSVCVNIQPYVLYIGTPPTKLTRCFTFVQITEQEDR